MSARRTFLLITQSQLARVDVVGGKTPRADGIWVRERIPGESIATLADAAIRLGPKKTGDVWVFSNDFWTGVVHLASDVAGALDGEELDQAIALEAETYSGISAFESRLGLKALAKDADGDFRWWVTQISQSDWGDVSQVVEQFRGKLAGMAHASLAAFPENLGCETVSLGKQWRLNQAFGEFTISINGAGDEIREVITLGDVKTQHTRAQLLDWCEDTVQQGQSLAWMTDQSLPELLVDASCTQISLAADTPVEELESEQDETVNIPIAGETAFGVWAETMAVTLPTARQRHNRMPAAIAEKPPLSHRTASLVACSLGLLVGIGCLGLHWTVDNQLTGLTTRVDEYTQAKKALTENKKALLAVKKELTAKQQELAELTDGNQELSASLSKASRIRHFQQTRWLRLISALSRSSDGGCWVRGLDTEGKVVTVRGLALSNQEISVFASNLEKYATPHGWRVHPAQTERNELSLIKFEVSLDVSDREAPDPGAESSLVRSITPLSFLAAPIRTGLAPTHQPQPSAQRRNIQ